MKISTCEGYKHHSVPLFTFLLFFFSKCAFNNHYTDFSHRLVSFSESQLALYFYWECDIHKSCKTYYV